MLSIQISLEELKKIDKTWQKRIVNAIKIKHRENIYENKGSKC